MPVVITHKAKHGILHIIGVVITTTIAAVSGTVRIDLDGLAASVDGGGRAVRLSLSLSVHHVESITQVAPEHKKKETARLEYATPWIHS